MRRSAIALWASTIALALTAGPAAAASGEPAQQTDGSTGAAQAGEADVDAPVRVLSDGDNAADDSAGQDGSQSSGESNGSAQTGDTDVDAPVRVLSDGDNSSADSAGED